MLDECLIETRSSRREGVDVRSRQVRVPAVAYACGVMLVRDDHQNIWPWHIYFRYRLKGSVRQAHLLLRVKSRKGEYTKKAGHHCSDGPRVVWLPGEDSNLERQDQNLLCYHYTTGKYRASRQRGLPGTPAAEWIQESSSPLPVPSKRCHISVSTKRSPSERAPCLLSTVAEAVCWFIPVTTTVPFRVRSPAGVSV